MVALPKEKWTVEAYLAFDSAQPEKHEFFNGEVYAMTGASRRHGQVTGNTFAALHSQLRKQPCEIYVAYLRVKVQTNGDYAYPDIAIVCGEPQFERTPLETLLNPTVLIEVLSPSTEGYDRGIKFQSYRALDSLREYLLVSQNTAHIEHYTRQGEQWVLRDVIGLDGVLSLESIGCTLALADVYEKVQFDEAD
ncbi:MAG: Uma2 family endonuclease [bacterium]|nr:Uma2 family endonuclease [bacterium]